VAKAKRGFVTADQMARRQRRQMAAQIFAGLHKRFFEQGDDLALLQAIALVVLDAPGPTWAKDAFLKRLYAWEVYQFPTLDAAFRVERRGKHTRPQWIREAVRWMVVRAVVQRGQAGILRDDAFEAVAGELQRSVGWVRTLFYEEASERWRAFFRDPELTPAEIAAILRKSYFL
jgi:hypothetical protein